jgi:hypothetical protein
MSEKEPTENLPNPETEIAQALLEMAEKLHLAETPKMTSLREDFKKSNPTTDEDIRELVTPYIEIGHELTSAKDSDPDTRLAMAILLVVFYLPIQNQTVLELRNESIDNAIDLASNVGREDLITKLEDLL